MTNAAALAIVLAAALNRSIANRNAHAYLGTAKRGHLGRKTQHAQQSARLIRGRFYTRGAQKPATPDSEVPLKHLSSAARARLASAAAMRVASVRERLLDKAVLGC
jgi:hypothetical protein